METQEYFARELKHYREKWNWTQRKVAEKAGTTQRVIAEIELGKYNPTFEMAERIAGAFGMRLEVHFRPHTSGYTQKRNSGHENV
jgi:putative transcriptional regulator